MGKSGEFLDERLARVGISRQEVFVTNVCKYRAPDNKIEKFFKGFGKGNIANQLVLEGVVELYEELSTLTNCNVFVPVGNVALWALVGHMAIGKRRGSILSVAPNLALFAQIKNVIPDWLPRAASAFAKIQGKKVIGTYHPAAIQYKGSLRPIFDFDLARIYEESKTKEIVLPQRTHHVNPTKEIATELAKELWSSGLMTVDIELIGYHLYCVGFSCDKGWSLTLTTDEPWKVYIITELLKCNVLKVFQNGLFDAWFLDIKHHIKIKNYVRDTMIAQRIAFPDYDVGLDFLASFHTREPYYKDEGKNWEPKDAKDVNRFLTYNGKDACVTKEVDESQQEDNFKDEPGLQYMLQHKMKLVPIALEMQKRGWLLDLKVLADLRKEHEGTAAQLQAALDKGVMIHLQDIAKKNPKLAERCVALATKIAKNLTAKEPKPGFNVGSTGEGNIVDEYFYGIRAFKPKYNKITKKRTTDEEALKEVYGETGDPIALAVCKLRQEHKLISTELSVKYDSLSENVGKTYFSINPCRTKSGRWAFTNNIFDYGCNGQAWHPKAKRMVVAPAGYVIINLDLRQAEDRIVANMAHITKKLEAFANGTDAHALTATGIFGGTIAEIRSEDKEYSLQGKQGPRRYIGKQSNHSFNYGLGPLQFFKRINKDSDETGVRITERKAKEIRRKHLEMYPEIPDYWKEIEQRLWTDHFITNHFGWKRTWYSALNDEVFRDFYSWIPQSDVPHIIDIGMLRIKEKLPEVQMILHGHDSITAYAKEDEADDIIAECKKLMRVDFEINGKELYIPVDAKKGPNYGELK